MNIYKTVQGDTFDIIAKKCYKNELYIHLIMQANPEHIQTIVFNSGIELKIPDIDTSVKVSQQTPWRE